MKTIYNYAFRIVCVYVFALSIFAITSLEINTTNSKSSVVNINNAKELESSIITKVLGHDEEKVTEPKENEKLEEEQTQKQEEVVPEVKEEVIIEKPKEEVKNTYNYVQTVDTSGYQVLQTVSGSLSHYGHDCYGCTSGRTASGYDVSDGRIYYTDPAFGSVRIVAAGGEYPLGTILRLTNVESSPIVAIVLDRGGAIGAGKSFTLDLLTESNARAYELGVRYGVLIEVLRFGY